MDIMAKKDNYIVRIIL